MKVADIHRRESCDCQSKDANAPLNSCNILYSTYDNDGLAKNGGGPSDHFLKVLNELSVDSVCGFNSRSAANMENLVRKTIVFDQPVVVIV